MPSVIFLFSKKRNAMPDTDKVSLEKTGKNKEKPNKTIIIIFVFSCFS